MAWVSSRWVWLVVCTIGLLVQYWAFHPGFMSPDSLSQFQQALTSQYGDWHPPAMAFWWHLLLYIHPSPQPMLLFQLCCFWASCYLLLRTVRHPFWAVGVMLFACAPFTQNFVGYIIKDSQMALCWLLLSACLLQVSVQQRAMKPVESIVTLLLLVYGTLVRPNALPGCIPLAVWWVGLVVPLAGRRRKAGITALVVVGVVACQWLLLLCLQPKKEYPQNKLYLHDLTGIYVKSGVDVFPASLTAQPAFDTAYMRRKYHPATFDNVWWNEDGVKISTLMDGAATHQLFNSWVIAIVRHPATYLRNRYEGFLYYLRLRIRTTEFFYYFPWIHPNDVGLVYKPNKVGDAIIGSIKEQSALPFMKPWFWFSLNILLLPATLLVRQRAYRYAVLALTVSGLLYQLPSFFIFQVDTDFRYFYWNCLACSLCILLLLADRLLPGGSTTKKISQ